MQTANYPGPFLGRVVDQETNQPIEGAVVHVDWHLTHPFSRQTYFDAKEVLTDKNGKFFIRRNWSILPWRNFFINSETIIFKAGYGIVEGYYGPDLHSVAESIRNLSETERKRIGPGAFFNIRFEGELPVFLLKKLSKEEAANDFPVIYPNQEAPLRKRRLILEEINRHLELFGWHTRVIK